MLCTEKKAKKYYSNRLSLSCFLFLLTAKNHFCSRYPQLGRVGKLSPKAFQAFLELVASELTGDEDEVIDNIVEFLTTRVERSHMECLQSLARRRWLHNIQQAAESSGARMDPVYEAVLKALLKVLVPGNGSLLCQCCETNFQPRCFEGSSQLTGAEDAVPVLPAQRWCPGESMALHSPR